MSTSQAYTLNVFSNVSELDPRLIPIKETLESFEDTFGYGNVAAINFFIHPFPFQSGFASLKRYIEGITQGRKIAVFTTRGLAHGYLLSLVVSDTDYCFQLEHDWLFHKDVIGHSDLEIIEAMKAGGIHHLRFNKRPNTVAGWDKALSEETISGVPLCRTTCRGNNPHFIDRKAYLDRYAHLIDVGAKDSGGVEALLSNLPHSYIYGALNTPPAIEHINGRARLRFLRKIMGNGLYNFTIRTGVLERAMQIQDMFRPTQTGSRNGARSGEMG